MHKPKLLHLTALAALALAATPANAVTALFNFSFTANGKAAKGIMWLDCLPHSHTFNCTITALTGQFGADAMTLNPPPPQPDPPAPPIYTVNPDYGVAGPHHRPSERGFTFHAGDGDFWLGETIHDFPPDDPRHGKPWTWMVEYNDEYEPVGPVFDINDYQSSIPEPASWALMVAGFGLIGAAFRRQARTSASGGQA